LCAFLGGEDKDNKRDGLKNKIILYLKERKRKMRKYVFIILAVLFSVYMLGCGKKNVTPQEAQEAMSIEAMNALNVNMTAATPEPVKPQVVQPAVVAEPKVAPITPTIKEIQTALKNAGYYKGSLDGKMGPKTKKAIEEFQKASDLKADGKVGRKTWSLLSKYFNAAPAAAVTTR